MLNLSSLSVYYSKENLTVRFADYSNVFLLPTVCYIGVLFSILSLFVSFRSDESNAKTLNYIFLNSLIDFLFLITQSFLVVFRCGVLCPYGYKYASKFYEIYIFLYFGYILVTSQVLLNIWVAYDRLKMFSGKLTGQKPTSIFKVYAVFLVISTFANAPNYLLPREIVPLGIYKPDPNSTYYDILYIRRIREIYLTPLAQNLLTTVLAIKDPFLFLVLCVMSIIVCVRFRIYLKSRKSLVKSPSTKIPLTPNMEVSTLQSASTQSQSNDAKKTATAAASSERKENNFTILTSFYCMKILIGNFIDSFSMIASVFDFDIYVRYGFINIAGNFLLYASHAVSFFLYFFFYNLFKQRFLEFFRLKPTN